MMSPRKKNTDDTKQQELQQEIDHLQEQVQEKEEAHKRVLADYHNLLRRTAEEKKVLVATANQNILADLLPTLDHLEMAMNHFQDSSLQMIVNDLKKTLENYGLRRIDTVGTMFDPALMEAVDTEPGEDGKVLREQRAGYRLNDTVLRYAEVVVGKKE